MERNGTNLLSPHVIVFPFPIQGHLNSMLKLAELLCLSGLHVSFLVTDHVHRRLTHHSAVESRFSRYPGFRFKPIPDGLPEDHPRSIATLMDLFDSLRSHGKLRLREFLISSRRSCGGGPPVTCIIADGILSFAIDVAEEIGIPLFYFRTVSACSFWAYFCIPQLIDAGEVPFSGEDLDVPIESVPGMEGFLRRRDLPSFCRVEDISNPGLQMVIKETQQSTRSRAVILNTMEELEGPILSQIRTRSPNLYPIGPLNAHLQSRLDIKPSISSTSLWKEDKSCLTWLHQQPLKCVVYVSFGSLTVLTREQVMEFWYGLVNSGARFLWVLRPDCVAGEEGESHIPVDDVGDRGRVVEWAPQEEVLAHPSVGGFLTHSGWNSTLESIVAGVPMICWPYFADQQTNSRYVGEVWKLGLDMKDICDRATVERMIRDLMEVRRHQFLQSANQMASLARRAVSQGGTSFSNLDRLIQEIRLITSQSEK